MYKSMFKFKLDFYLPTTLLTLYFHFLIISVYYRSVTSLDNVPLGEVENVALYNKR